MSESRPLAIRHETRVRLLAALSSGSPVVLARFSAASGIPMSAVEYHVGVLAAADAVTVRDDTATITAAGRELHRLAQVPERRQGDRRRGDRRL